MSRNVQENTKRNIKVLGLRVQIPRWGRKNERQLEAQPEAQPEPKLKENVNKVVNDFGINPLEIYVDQLSDIRMFHVVSSKNKPFFEALWGNTPVVLKPDPKKKELKNYLCYHLNDGCAPILGTILYGSILYVVLPRYKRDLYVPLYDSYTCDRFLDFDIKDIFVQILQTVNQLHASNLYHRDLKPENIYLVKENKIKPIIADFETSTRSLIAKDVCGTRVDLPPWAFKPGYDCSMLDRNLLAKLWFWLITKISPRMFNTKYENGKERDELWNEALYIKDFSLLLGVRAKRRFRNYLSISLEINKKLLDFVFDLCNPDIPLEEIIRKLKEE